MTVKKTAITLATILGFTLIITGCNGSGLKFGANEVAFPTVVDNWQAAPLTYVNDTDGQQIYTYNAAPTAVDFDGNGTLDLVVGDGVGNLEVMVNGSTTGLEVNDFYMIGNARGPGYFCDNAAPIFIDVDNDGRSEMFVGCGDGSVLYVDFSDVTPNAMQFTTEPVIADGAPLIVPGGYAVPAIYDANGDGAAELLASSGDGSLYAYTILEVGAAPVVTAESNAYLFGSRAALVAADLDNNGNTDFVTGNGDGLVQACKGPTPTDCLTVTQTPGLAKPTVGDFNHDGLQDLVIGAGDGSIQIMIATPTAP